VASEADTGRAGERAAARFLTLRGWRVASRNWRGGGGEIDLVAVRRGVVAFCEVKTRADRAALAEPLRAAQRRRLRGAALAYLRARPDLAGHAVRFDLLTVRRRPGLRRVRRVPGAVEGAE
jgi:putative endonuclease